MKNIDSLTKLFCKLVSIPSPTGKELQVSLFIKKYLDDLGIDSQFDKTGHLNNSNSNNLIVKIVGDKTKPFQLFVAHVDTVETGEEIIKPKIIKNTILSSGETILGADNKSSVAVLLETLTEINKWKLKPNVIVAFVTSEEKGIMGSSLLDIRDKVKFAFNLDGGMEVGTFVYQSLGEVPFEIELIGKASHSAIEPEKGINAIKTAALIIAKLKLGRTKKGLVLNIGKINGGRANNIVPDKVKMSGQVRAFTQAEIDKELLHIRVIAKNVCNKTGCKFKFVALPKEGAPAQSLDKGHAIIKVAQKASKVSNIKFRLKQGFFTSDSNFIGLKYPVITVGRGGKNPHSNDESIKISELHKTKKLILEIIKQTMT